MRVLQALAALVLISTYSRGILGSDLGSDLDARVLSGDFDARPLDQKDVSKERLARSFDTRSLDTRPFDTRPLETRPLRQQYSAVEPEASQRSLTKPTTKQSARSPMISIYLASAFHNNAHTLGFFERACEDLASLPSVSWLHVTVYESGSTDGTDVSLMGIEERLLRSFGSYNQKNENKRKKPMISTAFTVRGARTRDDRQRIEFLADVRNELIAPLRSLRTRYDFVVFANDVFFTADDVIKLIEVDGDVVCGMDFTSLGASSDLYKLVATSTKSSPRGKNNDIQSGNSFSREQRVSPNLPVFYDAWVARTLEGLPFRNLPPYVSENEENVAKLRAVAQREPIFCDWFAEANFVPLSNETTRHEVQPVQCCWNGLLAVRAEPFYRGLTFRSNLPSECLAASESHMCTDLWNMGYRRVAVHNGVRLSYDEAVRKTLEQAPVSFFDVPFGKEKRQKDKVFSRPPTRATMCCGMKTRRRIERDLRQTYSRLPFESDRDFAVRVWKHLSGDSKFNGAYDKVKAIVASKPRFRPADFPDLLALINHNIPHLPCRFEVPMHLTSEIRWASKNRKIPLRITQIGPRDLYDGLTPLTWTWRQLHPDHEYEFLSYEDVLGKDYITPSLRDLLLLLLQLGMSDFFEDIAKYAVMLERGGIYADLDTVASRSLSDGNAVRDDDEFVIGLESNFKLQRTADEWNYPSRRGVSSHFFAVTPGHALLLKILRASVESMTALVEKHAQEGFVDLDFSEQNNLFFAPSKRKKAAPFVTGSKLMTDVVLQEGGRIEKGAQTKGKGLRVLSLLLTSGSHLQGASFYKAHNLRYHDLFGLRQHHDGFQSDARTRSYVHRYQPSLKASSLNTSDDAFEEPVLEWAGCVLRYEPTCAIRFPWLKVT